MSVAELNSQSAKRWQKDGSLVVEIENMVDANEGSVTATRTVVLGFVRSDKAKVLKSTRDCRGFHRRCVKTRFA